VAFSCSDAASALEDVLAKCGLRSVLVTCARAVVGRATSPSDATMEITTLCRRFMRDRITIRFFKLRSIRDTQYAEITK
jgi:hypothetical protein